MIDPAHRPVCAIRLESNTTRSCARMKCCGSTWGGMVPSQVRSNDRPNSFGPQHHAEPLKALENLDTERADLRVHPVGAELA